MALVSATHATSDQQLRSQANAVAAQDQERLRGLSDEQLANFGTGGSTRTVQVNGTSFQVTSTAAFQDAQGNSSCTSTAVDYYKTTSTVRWTEGFHGSSAQSQSLTVESLLSRPVSGNLATSITDPTGAGVPGVTVTATPPSGTPGQSAVTVLSDGTGCAMMTGLQPANYSLNIAETGWVDFSDSSPTVKSASVTSSGTPTTVSVVLGQAGAINASFTTNTGAGGEANAISYTGAGNTLTSPATLVWPTTPGTQAVQSITASNLFPFNQTYGTPPATYTNNWTVYAGSCSYQAPPATPTSYLTKYTVGPAQTTSTATSIPSTAPIGSTGIQEPMINLGTIQGKVPATNSLKSVQPTDIVLTYTNGTCKDQYEGTIATPQSGSGVGATPPTTGWLANPGQPYAPSGDLSICADYAYVSGGVTKWYTGTGTAFANTSWTTPTTAPTITLTNSTSPATQRCPGAS